MGLFLGHESFGLSFGMAVFAGSCGGSTRYCGVSGRAYNQVYEKDFFKVYKYQYVLYYHAATSAMKRSSV